MGIPAVVQDYIRKKYQGQNITLLSYPIWSVIRFVATLAAGPPVVATIDTTARVAFSYGVGGVMSPAGQTGILATQADTNLQNPGQTRDQADVFIYGISATLDPRSEASMVGDVFAETDVQISTNANTQIPLGKMHMFPQPGGLFGTGQSAMKAPGTAHQGLVNNGEGVQQAFMTNGNPTAGSYVRLDAPIFWAGLGVGPDSNLQLTCTPRRTVTRTAALARVAGAAGATYNGDPLAFTPPSVAGSIFVGVEWRLHAVSVQKRGVNS